MSNSPLHSSIRAITQKWIQTVVVAHDFCPFARKELERNSIGMRVLDAASNEDFCVALLEELRRMDTDGAVETALLICANSHADFDDYLLMVGDAESCLESEGYEGVYQLASFHPNYCFVDATPDDAANYTNRSPFPMIHILRSSSVEEAIEQHPDTEAIPQRNIAHARELGATVLKKLLEQCWFDDSGNFVGQ